MEKENFKKYWWHKLYKVILWFGSIIIGFLSGSQESYFFDFLPIFLFFGIISFFVIVFVYKIILFIVLRKKISLTKKEIIYFFLGILIILITWIIYDLSLVCCF